MRILGMDSSYYLRETLSNSSLNNGYNLEQESSYTEAFYLYTGTCLSIFTNLLFVVTVLFKKKYRRPMNYILVYLSLTSCTSMTINVVRYMMQRQAVDLYWFQMTTNNWTCRFWVLIQRISIAAFSLSTMTITEERIQIIRNPLMRRSAKHFFHKMLCITLYSILVSIPVIFTRAHDKRLLRHFRCCKVAIGNSVVLSTLHGIWQFVTATLGPTVKLLYEHWKTRFQIKYLLTREGRRVLIEDRRQQLFLTSCIFSVIFLFCWVPYGILVSLKDLPSELFVTFDRQQRISSYFKAARNLVLLHMAINPVLFFVLNYQWTFKGFLKAVTS